MRQRVPERPALDLIDAASAAAAVASVDGAAAGFAGALDAAASTSLRDDASGRAGAGDGWRDRHRVRRRPCGRGETPGRGLRLTEAAERCGSGAAAGVGWAAGLRAWTDCRSRRRRVADALRPGARPESPLRTASTAADRGFFAVLNQDFGEDAVIEGFHFHGGFVGFDFGEDVTDFDGVADLFVPFDEGALGHGVREFGHFDVHRHGVWGWEWAWRMGKCGGEFQSFYGGGGKRKSAGSLMVSSAL